MPYRMMHPEHGFHNCYSLEEVKQHEAHGWIIEEKKEEKPVIQETEQKKRQGRPKKAS